MKWLVLAAVALLLQACGGGGSSAVAPANPPAADASACPVADQRASLRSFLDDQYFWYANLAAPDEGATSMDGYFQSMLYRPTDRYSFTQPAAAFNQIFTDGRRIGYGYTIVWADAAHTVMRVRNVEPRSPVAQAGLARGDIIVSIDGFTPQAIAAGQAGPVTEAGIERTFVVRNAAGVQRVLRVRSADYPLTPVVDVTTFDAMRGGVPVKVGYLAYTQFVQYSSFDLYDAFVQFAAAGAGEMILDLRYNGGGSVAVSRDLASMIGGARTGDLLYAYLRFNDKNRGMNTSVAFNNSVPGGTPFPMAGGVPRLIVIGSGSTASASELIINGLRPFMPVVLVGETTYGKPYGFIPRDNCGTIYNAVQFTTVNTLNQGNYDTGFTPDCAVADDLDHQLGDPAEARIHAALGYIETGRCPVAPQAAATTAAPLKPSPVFGDTVPSQMFMN